MLNRQLLQPFPLGQRPLDPLHAAQRVVLRLVKDLLLLQDLQHLLLPLQNLLGLQQLRQLVHIDSRLGTFLCQQFRALGAGGLQSLDPGGRRTRHDFSRMGGIQERVSS